jgi:hypothetical protein
MNLQQCEAALCVWEHLLNKRENEDKSDGFHKCWNDYGTSMMRAKSILLGRWANDIWRTLQDEAHPDVDWDVTFDWDFIPRIMRYVIWISNPILGYIQIIHPRVKDAVSMYRQDYSTN